MNLIARKRIYWGAAAVVTVAFSIMFLKFPLWNDDFWFLDDMGFTVFGRESSEPLLQAVWRVITEHFQSDVSRLGNSLAIASVVVPHWIVALLSSGVFAAFYLALLRLSEVKAGNLLGLTAVTACLTLGWPWQVPMWGNAFAFNYLWSSAVMCWCLILALKSRPGALWLYILAGLIGGVWHEAFSASLLAALTALFIFHPALRSRQNFAMFATAGAGFILCALSGGFQTRLGSISGFVNIPFDNYLLCYMVWCTIALCFIAAIRKPWRRLLTRPQVLCFVASLPCIWMVFKCGHIRPIIPCATLAIPAAVVMLRAIWPRGKKFSRLFTFAFAGVLWVVMGWHNVLIIKMISRLNHSTEMILDYGRQGLKYGRQVIPTDVFSIADFNPLIALRIDRYTFSPDWFTALFVGPYLKLIPLEYVKPDFDRLEYAFVPAEILEIDPVEDTTPLGGPFQARLTPGNYIISPDTTLMPLMDFVSHTITWVNGVKTPGYASYVRFPARDGHTWTYFYIHMPLSATLLRSTPVAIEQ